MSIEFLGVREIQAGFRGGRVALVDPYHPGFAEHGAVEGISARGCKAEASPMP
jgi:hypothetical protein